MNLARLLLRVVLGRRAAQTSGQLRVPGLNDGVTIRRDRWGVPHVEAESDTEGWFGLGFCHGQDRAFQLEVLLRFGRGTLAELIGPQGVGFDRMSRRVGFYRAAVKQVPVLADDVRAALAAYTAGVNAGHSIGLPRRPHEFVLLRSPPTPWEPADVLAGLKLQSFLLPANWDVELARLRILLADGPAALQALDPAYPDWHPTTATDAAHTTVLDYLAADLARFQQFAPNGGGSNNWALAGTRTASGKPVLANDPHLSPVIPAWWYLAHVRTPTWSVAGATFVGGPAFPVGHNGFACWGVTAGLTDTTDLFLETLGPDGTTSREADGSFAPCEVVREVIRVKGGPDVVEDVTVTRRGPIVSPVGKGVPYAVSLRAVWLLPLPLRGFLGVSTATSWDQFRNAFREWPVLPLNVVYADTEGTTGWQLVGQLPVRKGYSGTLPMPADAPDVGWEQDLLPFEQMPFEVNPSRGFVATANNKPTARNEPYLGSDWCDGYRMQAIVEELGRHATGWNVADCQRLQQSVRSVPWDEMRDVILALMPTEDDATTAWELLRGWDGNVAAGSAAASVFELFVAEMAVRVAKVKAPKAWCEVVGGLGDGLFSHNMFGTRRVGHLTRLLREQPPDWFPRPWADEMSDALASVLRRLRRDHGPGPTWWHWGDVRPLRVRHILLGTHRILGRVFNLPAVPFGGDANTVNQAATRPTAPTADPHMTPTLRAVFDTADWSNSRFGLCGGQSGNRFDEHYDDLFSLWQRGDGVPIPFAPEDVFRAARRTLRLDPAPTA